MSSNRQARPLPSVEEIRSVVVYDTVTGDFFYTKDVVHRGRVTRRIGDKAGGLSGGYVLISICGRAYGAHRLAWKLVTGADPAGFVDHIDGIKSNNAWSNLREATARQNAQNRRQHKNNKSGHKGVMFRPSTGKFTADIRIGTFDTLHEASAAYDRAAELIHGEFARTNAANDNFDFHRSMSM